MKPLQLTICLGATLFGIASLSRAADDEHVIDRSDLPAAVSAAVDRLSDGAKLRGLSEEMQDGRTFYEAELRVDAHAMDVLIDEDGTIVEVEEQVELDSLPAAVRAALSDRAGSGKIMNVEALTRQGILVSYEAHVRTDGRMSEITVGPQGEVRE
jgi:hypothetical protein